MMEKVVERLKELGRTISTMESCTGGGVANAITNVEGASEVLKFSAVTYSNEFKIKFGVSAEVIAKYSVYSRKTAIEMSKKICDFSHASYGVGVTGKLNRQDKSNMYGEDNKVFISIYSSLEDVLYEYEVEVQKSSRKENKEDVIAFISDRLLEIMK